MTPEEYQAIIQRARELQAAAQQPDAQAAAAAQQFAAMRQQQAQQLAQQQALEAQQQQAAMAEAQRQYTMNRSRTAGELAGDVGLSVGQGIVGLGQGAYGLANMASLGFLDRAAQATGFAPDFQRTQQILEAQKSEPLQLRKAATDAAFDEGLMAGAGALLSTPTVLADYGVQALPYLLPGAAIPRAAGAAAGARAAAAGIPEAQALATATQAATRANYATQAGLGAGLMNIDAINAAREAGATEGEQQAIGLGGGLAAGVALPLISRLTGAAGLEARAAQAIGGGAAAAAGQGTRLGAIGVGTLREGVEEAGQSAAEQAIQNVAGSRPVLEDVGKSAVIGGLTAAPLGAAMGAVTPVAGQPATTEVQQAAQAPAPSTLDAVRQPSAASGEVQQLTSEVAADLSQTLGQDVLRPSPLAGAAQQTAAQRAARVDAAISSADSLERQVVGGEARVAASQRAAAERIAAEQALPDFLRDQRTPATVLDQEALLRQGVLPPAFSGTVPTPAMPDVGARLGTPNALPPDFVVSPSGEAMLPQYDLLGQLTDMRAPQQPAAQAAPVLTPQEQRAAARLQPELGLQQDTGTLYVGQEGGPASPFITPEFARQPAPPPAIDEQRMAQALQPAFIANAGPVPAPAIDATAIEQAVMSPDEHRRAVRDAVMKQAGLTSRQIGGSNVKGLIDDMVSAGVDPRVPGFAAEVGRRANERLMAVDAEGKASQPLLNIARAFGVDTTQATQQTEAPAQSQAAQQAAQADAPQQYMAAVNALTTAQSAADVDTVVSTIRSAPEFAALPMNERIAMEGQIAAAIERATGAKFTLADARAKPATAAVRAAVRGMNTDGVAVHDTVADLQRAVGFQPPSTTKGVYVNGQTHVVLENIADPTDLALTVAHERGHAGLDQLLGQSLRAATNRMWANPALRRKTKTKMAETGYDRALAAEEVLADMLASDQRLPNDVWSKLYTGVRNFIARLFGTGVTVTNQQINDLMADVARVMRGAPAGSVRADMRNPELWLTDPAVAASQNPKFSKAKEDTLDAIIRSAANEGKTTPFNELVQSVARATVDTAKNTADWLGSGGVSGTLVRNSLPLNQIANLYDRLFGGRIGALSRLKTAKDARFNSLNAREQEWQFGEQQLAKKSVNDVGKEWMEYARKHQAKKQLLDRVLSDGSFYKVFPDKRELSKIDYDTVGYTQAEREAAAADIWKAWDALDAQGKNLYRYSQAMYDARWNQEYAAKQQELTRIGQALEGVDMAAAGRINRLKAELATAKGKMAEGPYSPLQRNGDYLVEARDADGKVLHFSAHDSRREALAAQAALRADLEAQGVTGATVGVDEKGQYQWRIDNVSLAKMDQIHRDVAAAIPTGASEEQRQQIINALSGSLVELYLQSLPPASFGNHAKNRKHVSGYDRDALRAFGAYAMKSARSIANTEYDGKINTAINEIGQFIEDTRKGTDLTPEQRAAGVTETDVGKMRQVFEGVRAQHAASLNTDRSKIGDALTQGSYIWFMTSPSQMFMNATQTWMVAFPRLAAKYGAGAAIKEINKAAGQYFTGGRDLIGERSALTASNDPKQQIAADVLTLLRERGPLDIGQAHDLSGVSDGSAGELTPYWGRAMEVMSYAMHHSEVFNRQVTAAANVALELRSRSDLPQRGTPEYDALAEALYDKAFQAIDDTQFNYSASNKPPVMQGPIGRLVFQFQMYRFHMLAMLGKDIRDARLGKSIRGLKPMDAAEAKEARAALSWLLAMQLGFTGTAGTVLAPFVFALADAYSAAFGDDDLTDSRTDWINYAGKYVAHGVAAGVIDTSRIASDSLIPYFGDQAYIDPNATNSEALQAYAIKYLGPWVGFLSDIGTGAGALADIADIDQYQTRKELWKALPKPLEDAAKSVDEYVSGVQDKAGIVYQQPSAFGSVSQFFGLRTAERRDAEQQRGAYYGAMSTIYDRQTRILGRLANAYATNDMAGVNEAMDDIAEWNNRYPDVPIMAQDTHKAIRSRIMKQELAAQTGVPMGRLPGPTIDEVLGR